MNEISNSPGSEFRCMQFLNMNDENQDPDRSKHFNYLTKFEVGFPFADHTNILYDPEYSENDWQTLSDHEDSLRQKMSLLSNVDYPTNFEESEIIDEDNKFHLVHGLANSLCKIIALPRTFRWVMSEWFYSNLDRPLLLSNNDFRTCLDVRFPYLKARRLTRGQWVVVKRFIGKPRRSSPKFFYQERKALSEKRQKLRTMERLVSIAASSGDESLLNMSMHEELLETLPVDFKLSPRLSPGTAVIVRMYQPNPGIFTGIVQEESKVYPNYGIFINSSILMVPNNDTTAHSDYSNNWYGYRIIPDTDVIGIKPPDNLISVTDLHAGASLSDAILSLTDEGKSLIANGDTSVNLRKYYKHTRHILADQLKNQPAVKTTDSQFSDVNHTSTHYKNSNVAPVQTTSQSSDTASSRSSIVMSSPLQNSSAVYNYSIPTREATSSRNYSGSVSCSGYTMEFLYNLMKLTRLMNLKSTFVNKLKIMNDEAEQILLAHSQAISLEFQHNYATLIVQLDNLKKEITQYFTCVLKHTEENASFFSNQSSSLSYPAQIVHSENFDVTLSRQFPFPGELINSDHVQVLSVPDGQHFDNIDPNEAFFKIPERYQEASTVNSNLYYSGQTYTCSNNMLSFAQPIFPPILYQPGQIGHPPNLSSSQEAEIMSSCNINQEGLLNNQFTPAPAISNASSMSYYPYFCPRPNVVPSEAGMYSSSISQNQDIPPIEQTLDWRSKCDDEAAEIISKSQEIQGHPLINARNFDLITKLMGLLMQIRNLTETRPGFSEVQWVQNGMKEIKSLISESNIELFESDIEQKVNHILNSTSQYAASVNYNPLSVISSHHQHS